MKLIALLSVTAFTAAMAVHEPPSRVQAREDAVISATLAPSTEARPKQLTSQGCFASKGDLVDPKGYASTAVTVGFCNDHVCNNSTVFAVMTDACFCGSTYPPKSEQVEQEKCSYSCPAYLQEACGGLEGSKKYWSVFNRGVKVDVAFLGDEDAASETPSDTPTVETTVAATPEESKTNVAGIVAGVVVGILVIAGVAGGIFFYMKKKRNHEIEEEHRRNAAVNSFMGHKPGSSGAISITDSRLDPSIMVQRRMSDGSIADNQDYSRKILRVTNA